MSQKRKKKNKNKGQQKKKQNLNNIKKATTKADCCPGVNLQKRFVAKHFGAIDLFKVL